MTLNINGRVFREVLVDDHYEKKHRESVSDRVILQLVALLGGGRFEPNATDKGGYQYFRSEPLFLDDKAYRLVWLVHPDENYIGIVNCFRRRYAKSKLP